MKNYHYTRLRRFVIGASDNAPNEGRPDYKCSLHNHVLGLKVP